MDQDATELPAGDRIPLRCEAVALRIGADQLNTFFPLLQRGVTVQAVVGATLHDFLCRQLAIPADYVAGRITTIFLDNRPVDGLESILREGSRVSLSAAMPGLVGAVMRRSGFYASLRQGITHAETSNVTIAADSGTVRLKLFNLLLPELGPLILARGVLLQRDELERLLGELSATSRLGIVSSYTCQRDACGGILLTVTVKE
jgi:hypothetical protein